jgi:hypothetical protein
MTWPTVLGKEAEKKASSFGLEAGLVQGVSMSRTQRKPRFGNRMLVLLPK